MPILSGTVGAGLLSLTMVNEILFLFSMLHFIDFKVTLNRGFMLFFPNKVDKIFTNHVFIKGHQIPLNSIIFIILCWAIPFALIIPSTVDKFGKLF